MTRDFCDRCHAEVTGKKSSAIHGIQDADRDGNGTANDHFDVVCLRCYRAFLVWMKGVAATKKDSKVMR